MFTKPAQRQNLKEVNGVHFSQKEIEIISHLLGGKSLKTIAHYLSISPRTVEHYLNQIKAKVNATSRDGVIDFIEKSGKLLDFKRYYLTQLQANQDLSISSYGKELEFPNEKFSRDLKSESAVLSENDKVREKIQPTLHKKTFNRKLLNFFIISLIVLITWGISLFYSHVIG